MVIAGLGWLAVQVEAQSTRTAPRATTPARPTPRAAAPAAPPSIPVTLEVNECPNPLGRGAQSRRVYCDVMIGREQGEGFLIPLPPHTGPVVLTFDLHNRHLYSDELIRAGTAYRRYTATIGVLTADNTLLSRFVVQNEFRTATDLVERISSDTGPVGAVKAVAPTGTEAIRIEIPAEEMSVSILGEKLTVIRPDGVDDFRSPGRPAALVSRVTIEYTPAPPPRVPARAPARRR